ncbi:MAG: hypothetical protein AAF763_15820 [Pseudomonadota bacterium]
MTGRLASVAGAAVLAASILPPAVARGDETARVRAGEHAAYSRLAIDLSDLGAWSVQAEGRRLDIRFPGRRLEFDTRHIFPQRRVSRVTSARQTRNAAGTLLSLTLSCDCAAEAYEFAEDMLVIDVRERVPSGPPAPRPPSPRPAPVAAAADEAAQPSAAPPEPARRPAAAPAEAAASTDAPPSSPRPPSAEDMARDVAAAQQALLRQLGRAVDQGLVNLRGEEDPEPARPPSAPPVPAVEPRSAAPLEDPGLDGRLRAAAADQSASDKRSTPAEADRAEGSVDRDDPSDQVQIRAATAFDDDRGRAVARRPQRICPSDEWLRAADWGEDEDFYGQLSALRARLVEEFDRPSVEAAMDVARLYIRFGLGAEAAQTLAKISPFPPEGAMLADAAAVVERGRVDAAGALAQAEACSGPTAAWRLAAGLSPSPLDVADAAWRDGMLSGFEALPLLLRRRLGPQALETLIADGALDLAEAMRLLVDRAPGDHGRRWDLAAGRLALARGEVGRGETLLLRAAEARDDVGAEALLEIAERSLAQDGALDVSFVERLGAASASRDGTALGRRLLVAELFGRAGRNELGEVLDLVALEKEARPGRQEDLDAALRSILKDAQAEAVGPPDYAQAVLAHLDALGATAAWDSARTAVARQLILIGLGNVARDVLAPVVARGGDDGRLAAASAQVALGRPADALILLQPVDPDRASRVEAEALAADGRHAAALERLRGEGDEPAGLAWRAGDWSAAADGDRDARRRALAAWMAEGAESDPPPSEPGLATSREALEQARRMRQQIMESLDDG